MPLMDWLERLGDDSVARALLAPERLATAAEAVAREGGAPPLSGLYSWYFDRVRTGADGSECHRIDSWAMLHCGISTKKPQSDPRFR
jgi:hypothetical protein